jgi:hypothetical protein
LEQWQAPPEFCRITLLRGISTSNPNRFVPLEPLVRHFNLYPKPFCPARTSCETFQPLSQAVLSRITFFRDKSTSIINRFVPNRLLSRQINLHHKPFCPESPSFETIQPPNLEVLSRNTLLHHNRSGVPYHPTKLQHSKAPGD